MYGVLQYLVIGVMLFSQNFIKDQTSGRLCEFRTVGWVRYHCFSLISDVFCSAHARVKLSVCHGGGTYTFFFFGGTTSTKASIRISFTVGVRVHCY